jgi:hypothetical protein
MTLRITNNSHSVFHVHVQEKYISGDASNPVAGTVKWNSANQCLQVYTGICWTDYVQECELSLSADFQDICKWARNKMAQEQQLQQRMKTNPALRHAYEQFQLLDILTQEETS